jgi:hypothetical protein
MTQALIKFEQSNHHPFRLRKIIVFSSLAIGVLGVCLYGHPAGRFFLLDYSLLHNGVLGLAIYIVCAPILDFWIHNILDKKASDYSDPEQLLESERINGKELDKYFDTRKKIRMVSLSLAGLAAWALSQISPYGIEAFCSVYILSTLTGIAYVRSLNHIRRPRLIYRDDQYYRPPYLPPSRPFWHMDFLNWYMGRGPMP